MAYLINQGVAPLIIKERVGHTDIKTTLNIYGHLYPNEQRKVAEMLNMKKCFFGLQRRLESFLMKKDS